MPRFSIRGLLAATALAALAISIVQLEQRLREAESDFVVLRKLQKSTQTKIAELEQATDYFGHAREEFAQHQQDMRLAEQEFGELAEKYGTLSIEDPDLLGIVAFPRARETARIRKTWIVHIPDGATWNLEVHFEDRESREVVAPLDFQPAEAFEHSLAGGRCRLEFQFHHETKKISFHVNGEPLIEYAFAGEGGIGYSHPNYWNPYQPRGPSVGLIDFRPGEGQAEDAIVFTLEKQGE